VCVFVCSACVCLSVVRVCVFVCSACMCVCGVVCVVSQVSI